MRNKQKAASCQICLSKESTSMTTIETVGNIVITVPNCGCHTQEEITARFQEIRTSEPFLAFLATIREAIALLAVA